MTEEALQKSETLRESEIRRLFTWFNAGNVLLLGSGNLNQEDISPKLTWKKINNPFGLVRFKKEKKDNRFPAEISKLGKYFLESGLNVNLIEIPENSQVHRRERIQVIFRKTTEEDGRVRIFFFPVLLKH